MIEIRQAEDDFPRNRLLNPLGHTGGLLCRRHAPILYADALRAKERNRARRAHRRFASTEENERRDQNSYCRRRNCNEGHCKDELINLSPMLLDQKRSPCFSGRGCAGRRRCHTVRVRIDVAHAQVV